MAQRRCTFPAYVLIAFVAMTAAGCYTILEHPDITREPDAYDLGGENDWYSCAECHAYPIEPPAPAPWPPPPDGPREWWRRNPPAERDIIERDEIFRREGLAPAPIAPPDPPGIVPGRLVPPAPPGSVRDGKETPPEEKAGDSRSKDWQKERDQRRRDGTDRKNDSNDRKRGNDSHNGEETGKRSDDNKDSNRKNDGERKKGG